MSNPNPYESPIIVAELNEPRPVPAPPQKSTAVPILCGAALFTSLLFMIGGIDFIANVRDCFTLGVAMVLGSAIPMLFCTIAIIRWMVTS